MALKLMRVFFGGYEPNYNKLSEKKYKVLKGFKPLTTSLNSDQGRGKIKGVVKKQGMISGLTPVFAYKRSDGRLLWRTFSNQDGTYEFRNIAQSLECFVVALDPNQEYNAVIQDNVVAK